MKKYKILLTMLSTLVIGSMVLTGCKKNEGEETPTYELTPVTQDALESGCYYVKDGDNFYKLPTGNKNFEDSFGSAYIYSSDTSTEEVNIDEEASEIDYDYLNDETRTLMYGPDDVCIPTLYSDQSLVYVTSDTVPDLYNFERFYDQGWSLGMYNLSVIDSGKVQGNVATENFYEGSDLKNQLLNSGEVSADDILTFDSINGKNVTGDMVTNIGTISGLKKNEGYPVKLYIGSKCIPFEKVAADIHYFSGFEKYTSNQYDYSESGYVTVKVPSELLSGYYYINGVGLVKYVKGNSTDNIDLEKEDFNIPFYYTDESGHQYTYNDINSNNTQENTTETTEIESVDGVVYTNKFVVDSSLQELVVTIDYQDATTEINGETVALNNDEVGFPSAKIIDPDGNEFIVEPSNNNQLSYTIKGAVMGEYTVEIYNCSKRVFNVATSAVTGNADTLVHTGSGRQALDYYLKSSLNNGVFTITWANTSHAADVVITGPDGTQYGKSINETQIVKDEYGQIQIRVGEVKYGEYNISIEGEELGRVQVAAAESAVDANEAAE